MRAATMAVCWAALFVAGTEALAVEPGWRAPRDFGIAETPYSSNADPLPGGRFLLATSYQADSKSWMRVDEIAGDAIAHTYVFDPQNIGDFDLATNPAGRAAVAWSKGADGAVVAFAAPGAAFGGPIALDTGGQFPAAPRIALDGAGNAVVVYDVDHGLRANFIPAGGSPGPPVDVATVDQNAGYTGIWASEVALADNGDVLVVWSEQHEQSAASNTWDYTLRSAHGNAGGFSTPATVATDAAEPQVEVDAQGGAVATFRRATSGTRAIALRPAGGQFGPPEDLPGVYQPVAAATAPDGTALIAYNQNGRVHVRLGSTTTASFGAPVEGDGANGVYAAIGWNGQRLLMWQDSFILRGLWLERDGSPSVARDIACGPDGWLGPGGSSLSEGHALVPLFETTSTASDTGKHVVLARADPALPPGSAVDCSAERQPAQPNYGPGSPGYQPNPYLFNLYYAYRNKTRRATSLLSPPASDGDMRLPARWSDGGSDNTTFSQDNRNVRFLAFDSAATNLVDRDNNHVRDVFLFRRARGGGNLFGKLSDATPHANGASSHPSLDGETHAAPHCVAFESLATNLSKRDGSRDRDVYVRDLRRNRTSLLSPGLKDAHDAVVDGRCKTVTFEARGSVWVTPVATGRPLRVATGTDPDQQTNGEGVAYVRAGQVWYRPFKISRGHLHRGSEQLVSATVRNQPGNGASANPSLDDSGHYVAFESAATDLCVGACTGPGADRNGAGTDIFRRTLSTHAPTKDRMQMANYSYDAHQQYGLESHNPVISGAGENILYDAVEYANQRFVRTWTFPRARGTGEVRQIRRECPIYLCKRAPIGHPSMSSRGNYIAFTSIGTEFCATELKITNGRPNCPDFTDVYTQYVGPSHEGYPLG